MPRLAGTIARIHFMQNLRLENLIGLVRRSGRRWIIFKRRKLLALQLLVRGRNNGARTNSGRKPDAVTDWMNRLQITRSVSTRYDDQGYTTFSEDTVLLKTDYDGIFFIEKTTASERR